MRERWCCVGRFLRERLCVVWCVCAGVSCCVLSVSEVRGQQELRALREAVVREAGVLGPGWARTKVNMAIFRHSQPIRQNLLMAPQGAGGWPPAFLQRSPPNLCSFFNISEQAKL